MAFDLRCLPLANPEKGVQLVQSKGGLSHCMFLLWTDSFQLISIEETSLCLSHFRFLMMRQGFEPSAIQNVIIEWLVGSDKYLHSFIT